MIRTLLLLSILAGIYLLWDKTSLPNVSPLSGAELTSMMKADGNAGDQSLSAAFAGVAHALSEKPPLKNVLSPEELALADASVELRVYVKEDGSDPRRAAQLVLSSIESLPNDDWHSRGKLLMLAQRLAERERGFNDSVFLSIGLRQLETPTSEDVRDPSAIDVIHLACDLVAKRTPDPAKRAALLSQLLPLHASEAVRDEIERALKP